MMYTVTRSPHPSRSPHLPPGSRSPMMTDGSMPGMANMANMANPHGNMSSMANPHGNMGNMANPLKVSIALGQKPAIIQKGPFYLMKPEPIVMSEVTGATNLMSSKNLEHSFQKLAGSVSLFHC